MRLDRFLADSGAGTRTEVKKLIQKGMVQVNGEKVKKPELKIDPETDGVKLGKERIWILTYNCAMKMPRKWF